MSDVSVTPMWERKPKDMLKAIGNPEGLMDLIDPGQTFEGEFYTDEKVDAEIARVKGEEKAQVEAEKKESAKKKLEATRKQRRLSASRKGRSASMVTGPLGTTDKVNVRRASLGGEN